MKDNNKIPENDMKTGIFYATTTGTTQDVAMKIAKALGVADADVYNVANTPIDKFADYEMLVVGSPTYGSGEVQDDWTGILDGIDALNLHGKTVAVFGCGDESMSDTFCNAVGILYNAFKKTGAKMVGTFNTFPYKFEDSAAVPVDGAEAVGLLIDEVNHPDATDKRIADWTAEISK